MNAGRRELVDELRQLGGGSQLAEWPASVVVTRRVVEEEQFAQLD